MAGGLADASCRKLVSRSFASPQPRRPLIEVPLHVVALPLSRDCYVNDFRALETIWLYMLLKPDYLRSPDSPNPLSGELRPPFPCKFAL